MRHDGPNRIGYRRGLDTNFLAGALKNYAQQYSKPLCPASPAPHLQPRLAQQDKRTGNMPTSAFPFFSHTDTVAPLTLNRAANAACVSPRDSRHARMASPVSSPGNDGESALGLLATVFVFPAAALKRTRRAEARGSLASVFGLAGFTSPGPFPDIRQIFKI